MSHGAGLMVRDGPSGLLTMRTEAGAITKKPGEMPGFFVLRNKGRIYFFDHIALAIARFSG